MKWNICENRIKIKYINYINNLFFTRKRYVYDHKNIKRNEDEYILAFNRFEHDTWEPTFMETSLEKFDGLHASGIGSKIGYSQHYIAMAISRVLCECYSDGNYCVYGDIRRNTIYQCLAYIGKKYGFGLVERFIECRTNFDIMKNKENYEELFWGVRGCNFYVKRYQDMDFDEWKCYMEGGFKEDLIKVEMQGESTFEGTDVYLASLFVRCLCERELTDKLELDKDQILAILKQYIQKYYINSIEPEWKDNPICEIDFQQYGELKKYEYYFKNMKKYDYVILICDMGIFCKSVRDIIENLSRDDSKEILDEFQKMIDEMMPRESKVNSSKHKQYWILYYTLKNEGNIRQNKIKKDIKEVIAAIAEDTQDIRSNLISDRYLKELMLSDFLVTTMSDELIGFLKSIFSEERRDRFYASVPEKKKISEERGNARKLLNLAEELLKDFDILFSSELFYNLLENASTLKGEEEIHKIEFYLKDISERNQREAFLWVVQDEKLRKMYNF